MLKFKEVTRNKPLKISDFNAVMSLCSLYDAMCKAETAFKKETLGASYNSVAEKVFLFSLVWTVGGALYEPGRKKLTSCLSDIHAVAPAANTLYDYYVDIAKNDFLGWDTKVPNWRPLKSMTFYDMIVPTVDTTRNSYILDTLMKIKKLCRR